MTPSEQEKTIELTVNFVKHELYGSEGGHDWWHIYRVWKSARKIAVKEGGNLFIVELGALLHDIADSKFHEGNEEIGPEKAKKFLNSLAIKQELIEHVINIIKHISFKGGNEEQKFTSPELAIVQDADRLDAIGAIGIARTFNYGGYKNRELYNPEVLPNLSMTNKEYKNSNAPTVNHFHEKLLLLKDRMNTKTGTKLAQQRHEFMEAYLKQFHLEWGK